ncbi:MAG: hypothetical protein JO061_09850 [Acidobacteriaceae bacterium]|nr:hypothetical protein [Acidobacteriaceae bacterium]
MYKCVALLTGAFLFAGACAGQDSLSKGQESVSAGGHWIRVHKKDAQSESVSFILAAETEEFDRHPSIVLTCTSGKRPEMLYKADVRLSAQARDTMNHYEPAIWALVKVDDAKPYKALWDVMWPPDSGSAILDHKTVRSLLTGSKMRVRFSDSGDESHLDDFTLEGLNVNDLRETCGARWFGKAELSASAKRDSKGSE